MKSERARDAFTKLRVLGPEVVAQGLAKLVEELRAKLAEAELRYYVRSKS